MNKAFDFQSILLTLFRIEYYLVAHKEIHFSMICTTKAMQLYLRNLK